MNTMVSYELIHNPSLFNQTHLGRSLAKTQTGFNRSSTAKPGPFDKPTLSNAGAKVASNIPPTDHWQSSYKNVSNTTTSRGRIVSRRPTWSINR